MKLPWQDKVFEDWMIVGMNHYRVNGVRHLYVAMTRGDLCISAEGSDEELVFHQLEVKAAFRGKFRWKNNCI